MKVTSNTLLAHIRGRQDTMAGPIERLHGTGQAPPDRWEEQE